LRLRDILVTVQIATKTQRIDMAFTPLSEKEEHIARKTVDAVPIASGYMMV